jgi:SPP1 gp7 family putative phage head morphogenesis protein
MINNLGRSHGFQVAIGSELAQFMAASDLLGRLHIMQHVRAKTGKKQPTISTLTHVAHFSEVLGFKSVQNKDAVQQIVNLNSVTRRIYDGLTKKYQQQAFTVAHVTDTRIIEQIQKALKDTVASGGTQQDFARELKKLTTDASIEELSNWHIENVFRTNVQNSYMTGRFEQMRQPDVMDALPVWEYFAVMDDRTRENHAAMNGFQAAADDPVWSIWYPPAGFNCRCSVFPLLESEANKVAFISGVSRLPDYPDEGFGGLGGLVA